MKISLRLVQGASECNDPGGVFPASNSRTELVTVLADSPDSFRCHGDFPNNFLTTLTLPWSSLIPNKDFVVETRTRCFGVSCAAVLQYSLPMLDVMRFYRIR